jgi:hypothetical protein
MEAFSVGALGVNGAEGPGRRVGSHRWGDVATVFALESSIANAHVLPILFITLAPPIADLSGTSRAAPVAIGAIETCLAVHTGPSVIVTVTTVAALAQTLSTVGPGVTLGICTLANSSNDITHTSAIASILARLLCTSYTGPARLTKAGGVRTETAIVAILGACSQRSTTATPFAGKVGQAMAGNVILADVTPAAVVAVMGTATIRAVYSEPPIITDTPSPLTVPMTSAIAQTGTNLAFLSRESGIADTLIILAVAPAQATFITIVNHTFIIFIFCIIFLCYS